MKEISPREVLARLASVIPPGCRENIVIIGSLAAGYHLLGDRAGAQVRTKDVDCLLLPRVEAVRAGGDVARQLLRAGWRPRADEKHGFPGNALTPDADLPAVRLHPPDSTDWFIELLAAHEPGDESDRRWTRLHLPTGDYGLPSFRHLDLAVHGAPFSLGLKCALPEMLALSNLLRNQVIRPDTMEALVEGRRIKRSNKDLGRVVAIARLSDVDEPRRWPTAWAEALRACHGASWGGVAAKAGAGLRALLRSEADLDEACVTSNAGLLASAPASVDQFRRVAERLVLDAIEPLEARARRAVRTGG